jgi:hypothetical protein
MFINEVYSMIPLGEISNSVRESAGRFYDKETQIYPCVRPDAHECKFLIQELYNKSK